MKFGKFLASVFCFVILLAAAAEASEQTRIRFARGRAWASVSSVLRPGATKWYVLGARRGQQFSGNVSSRNGCVKFTEGSTSMGFTTDIGDNRISVTNYCRGTTSYTMTVSINY